jgi:hypothetical protein
MNREQAIREIRQFANEYNLSFKLAMKFMIKHECKDFDSANLKWLGFMHSGQFDHNPEKVLDTFETPKIEETPRAAAAPGVHFGSPWLVGKRSVVRCTDCLTKPNECDSCAAENSRSGETARSAMTPRSGETPRSAMTPRSESEIFDLPVRGENVDRLCWLRDVNTTEYTNIYNSGLLDAQQLSTLEGFLRGDTNHWFNLREPGYGDCLYLCILQSLHDNGKTDIKTVSELKRRIHKHMSDNMGNDRYAFGVVDFQEELLANLKDPLYAGDIAQMGNIIADLFNVCIYVVDRIYNGINEPYYPVGADKDHCQKIFLHRYNHHSPTGGSQEHFDLLIPNNPRLSAPWPPQIPDDIDELVYEKYRKLWEGPDDDDDDLTQSIALSITLAQQSNAAGGRRVSRRKIGKKGSKKGGKSQKMILNNYKSLNNRKQILKRISIRRNRFTKQI